MPTTTVTNLIARAAAAADMEDNFVTSTQWTRWATIEHHSLYSRVARLGIPYHEADESLTFTGASQYNIAEPMAILGVYYIESDGRYRKLQLQHPVQNIGTPNRVIGPAASFRVLRNTDNNVTFRFFPNPPSGSGIAKVIPHPKELVLSGPTASQATSVNYPLSWEERIVLGMARRALAKEETINPLIETQIRDTDAVIEQAAREQLMMDAPKIRDHRKDNAMAYDWYFI